MSPSDHVRAMLGFFHPAHGVVGLIRLPTSRKELTTDRSMSMWSYRYLDKLVFSLPLVSGCVLFASTARGVDLIPAVVAAIANSSFDRGCGLVFPAPGATAQLALTLTCHRGVLGHAGVTAEGVLRPDWVSLRVQRLVDGLGCVRV